MKTRLVAAVLGLTFSFFCRTEPTQAQDPDWLFVGPDQQYTYSLTTFQDGLVVLATEADLFSSIDEGTTWKRLDPPGLVLAVAEGPGEMMLGQTPENVLLSLDRGQTWETVATADHLVSGIGIGPNATLYYSSPTRTDCRLSTGCIIYGGGIHVSSDSGLTWREEAFPDTSVTLIKVTSDGQLYGRANNYVIHSGDMGQTWEKVVLPSRYAVNHAIVSEAGRVWLSAGPELYTTGEGWEEIVLVKDFGDPMGLGRLYLDSNGSLYANVATVEGGVTLLKSDDEGSNWSTVSVPSERCECALTETRSGYLLLGTNAGVYRSVRPITTSRDREHVNKMGEALSLHVAPNPIHANGRISFESLASGLTQVEVYDMAGRLSAELARGWMSAGYHELNFDVREWARGVYIVRIRIGVISQSTLIVVQ